MDGMERLRLVSDDVIYAAVSDMAWLPLLAGASPHFDGDLISAERYPQKRATNAAPF